jgi:hypothetical protein
MNITKLTTITVALSAAMLLDASRGMADDATPAPSTPTPAPAASAAPSASPTGDARREEFRARMNGFIKTALKSTDDEWAVIQPLLEKVQTLQRESIAGRVGGFGGFGGFGRRDRQDGGNQPAASASPSPAANNRPDRMGSPESQALKAALDSDATSTEDIKAKLQALRDARKKNAADLEQARQDLEKVLTLRQEATLVNMGILE